MSAFLVDKYTIDRIVTLLDHERRRSGYFKEMLEKELNIDFTDLDLLCVNCLKMRGCFQRK
jgi:hypothetical protein